MSESYPYTKTVFTDRLIDEVKANADLNAKYLSINTSGSTVNIVFSSELTSGEEDDLTDIVNAHTASPTTAQQLKSYLDGVIYPFIRDFIAKFAAENIAMGITQAGKTGPVLGLFVKQYDVNADGFPFSLKDTFDTGSLYESIKVIQHLRDNSTEFDGLSPFITDDRLHAMKNSIEAKLGVTLT